MLVQSNAADAVVREDLKESEPNSECARRNHAMDHITGLVEFPRLSSAIVSFQQSIELFNDILTQTFEKVIGQWKAEAQTQYFTEHDIEAIEFAAGGDSESLQQPSQSIEPSPEKTGSDEDFACHEAKWIAASFTRSVPNATINDTYAHTAFSPLKVDNTAQSPPIPCQICHGPMCYISEPWASPYGMIDASPQSAVKPVVSTSPDVPSSPSIGSFRISELLGSSLATKNLKLVGLMHRKLLGVLLACALFQICKSPWTHRLWRRDLIYLYQYPKNFRRLEQLRLRIPCIQQDALIAKAKEPNTESIAAFGVLLLELEAKEEAEWDEDQDLDFEYDILSNQVRLGRILRDWEASVRDDYRAISQACHDFDSLVQTVDDPRITSENKRLAAFRKCIFEPLFKLLVRDFSPAQRLFEGVSGPWNGLSASFQLNSSKAWKRILYDEQDVSGTETKKSVSNLSMPVVTKPVINLSN